MALQAIGVIRANVVASNFDQLDGQVRKLSESANEPMRTSTTYDYAALTFYATSFAKEYLNMDTTVDEDQKNERLERLAKYLSLDVDAVNDSNNKQLEIVRKFKEASVTK
ncbi:conjugal transfer protein [Enterococcus durans]|uniref:conjugal transfer protein n=1 Tax=Enterococcus durans TaxID=53345 RepID=UPI00232E2D8E|nr:conjugal transfer protein [Enterococcus durans]MDB1652458.1 conjugal transfer protein [Enterococcus durans]MDB1655205.1 conjugal transfer protein [Enterococcus durans]MDB1662884.1 conjugal transfer protein [Enterococcus durans]MDB1668028.1 conjugal transfer protein [Enterococcus durans]MDB1670863.1 conjugal transfer protein [Enterococcus durans]